MPQSPNPNTPHGWHQDPMPVVIPPLMVGNENQLTPQTGLPPGAVSSPTRSLPPFGGKVKANTSGVWVSVKDKGDQAKGRKSGINTNQVNWGTPYTQDNPQNRQSAYRFDGLTPAVLTLDGKDCLLGTFTHFNYTITSEYSISQAILKLTIDIHGVGTKEFNVTFKHNETPNKPGPVPDKVSIPEISATQEVTIQGKVYALTITGFLQDGKVTRNFITEESQDNEAEIYCKLVLIEEPSPPCPPVCPTYYLIVCPPYPCPPPPPPVSPICVIYPPMGVIPGGQTGPTVIPGGQIGPTIIPGGQIGPTIIPGGQTGPTVIQGGQTGPTVIQGGQIGTTITQQTSSVVCSISCVGIWLNVVEELAGSAYLTGVGTNQISWGIPVGQGGKSCYYFEGVTQTSISLDGSSFTLGTLTHYNYPITGYSIRSATLQLTVKLNQVDVNFSFQFNHNEVANNGINGTCPLTPGFAPPCPDIVSISNCYSQELVTINERQYALCVVGFIQNNQIESQFITCENQVNVAQLVCQLVEVNNPSPSAAAPR
ncbi:MAG: choice-of-anchor K domain-containing protein [Cyanobacteriota bacterium]|nr:choice-of-anchor K domain-containing protein [Cyanobacteriota bacterium]